MKISRKFFGNAVAEENTIVERHSRNDYTYQIIEQIKIEELHKLLNGLKSKELRIVTENLHIRPLSANRVTAYNTETVRAATLRLFAAGAAVALCQLIARPLVGRTREILGDDYEDPSARQIRELTEILIEEFGPLRTKIFYAETIDGLAKATPHLLKEMASRTELQVELNLHDESPIDLAEPRPAPTEDQKVSRRDRRKSDREARSTQRQQRIIAKDANKQLRNEQKKRKSDSLVHTETANEPVNESQIIQPIKMEHGLLRRYVKASTSHPDVGQLKWAFISFGKNDPNEGKVRPCLIVAVAPKYYIVRPIYTNAGSHAGTWRAVLLTDWSEAGLDHESVVGHKTEKIGKRDVRSHLGSLSLRDWNKVCQGEVNTRS
jgi:hypothetical protein